MGVFSADAARSLSEVACNDDAGDSRTSRLNWQAQAGQEYRIVVGAFQGTAVGVLRQRLSTS